MWQNEHQDKIEVYTPLNPQFLLKDHKPDFNNKPSIRLIAQYVSDLGNISKKSITQDYTNFKI